MNDPRYFTRNLGPRAPRSRLLGFDYRNCGNESFEGKACGRPIREMSAERSGVKVIHGFRALYEGRLRATGAGLSDIQGLLGHSVISVTQAYFPGQDEHRRKVVKRLPEFGTKGGRKKGLPRY